MKSASLDFQQMFGNLLMLTLLTDVALLSWFMGAGFLQCMKCHWLFEFLNNSTRAPEKQFQELCFPPVSFQKFFSLDSAKLLKLLHVVCEISKHVLLLNQFHSPCDGLSVIMHCCVIVLSKEKAVKHCGINGDAPSHEIALPDGSGPNKTISVKQETLACQICEKKMAWLWWIFHQPCLLP